MTSVHLSLSTTGAASAVLTLPQPLTPQALRELEQALDGTLDRLRSGLRGAGAVALALRRPDAGDIEYASWLPDRGAIEVASWSAHLHTSLR